MLALMQLHLEKLEETLPLLHKALHSEICDRCSSWSDLLQQSCQLETIYCVISVGEVSGGWVSPRCTTLPRCVSRWLTTGLASSDPLIQPSLGLGPAFRQA